MPNLSVRDELPLNADPMLALDAIESFHKGAIDNIKLFAIELFEKSATPFFSVSAVTICFMTIKGVEESVGGKANELVKNALAYINTNGVEIASRYGVDAVEFNKEVSTFIHSSLLPLLNGNPELSLDFPTMSKDAAYNYVLSTIFVTYAFALISKDYVGENDIADVISKTRDGIEERVMATMSASFGQEPAAVPVEPNSISHFGKMKRSPFSSPIQEIMAAVDVTVPLQLAEFYDSANADAFRETSDDVIDGKVTLHDMLRSTVHFCRATMFLVANRVTGDDQVSFMSTASGNVTKALKEGQLSKKFGVNQRYVEESSRSILLSLSSLLSSMGTSFESRLPDGNNTDFREINLATVVALGMISSSYAALVTGRLGLNKEQFINELNSILSA